MIVTPCSTMHCLLGWVSSQLPPRSAARSTITEPGAIWLDHLGGDQHGRLLAGDHCGGDDDVALGDDPAQQLALALVEGLILGARVAAGVLGVLGFDGSSTKRPPRLWTCSLAAGRRSYAEVTAPSRRAVAIAWSPATPAPMTSTRAGVIVPAAVVSIGKQPRQRVGGEDDRLVAADRRHRRQRVHALGPRGPRHQLDRE